MSFAGGIRVGDASAPIDVGRKWAELKAKASSLRTEMVHWQEITADKTKPFTKHHSQVRRICGRIEGFLDAVDAQLDPRDGLLGRAGQIQNDLLKAHAIWEFYRSKLILRADAFLGAYLRVCDEFAWDCYHPAQELFKQALPESERETQALRIKEPPFVFLNGVSSPYAVPREKDFSAEMATGGWSMSGVPPRVLEKLPVPMIGLPWYQVSHLPDALVIGHEVGHVAEWDFRLTKATQDAITAARTKEEGAWMSWRSEIFADVYGCLAGGPSFVRSLVDFLLAEVVTVRNEQRTPNVWGQYPPVWLRVALVLETLSRSFPQDAEEIRNTWQKKYGVAADKDEWEKDMIAVIDQLLRGPYPTLGSCKLTDVLSFPTENGEAKDVEVAKQILPDRALSDTSPRVLLAAARRLYDKSPEEFVQQAQAQKVRDLVIRYIPAGTRGTPASDLDAVVKAEKKIEMELF